MGMEEGDPWLGIDKLEHVLACCIISILVAAVARRSQRPFVRRRSLALGSLAALLAGSAKEAADEIGVWNSAGGSFRDAAADALGIAIAAALLSLPKRLFPSSRRPSSNPDQEEHSQV